MVRPTGRTLCWEAPRRKPDPIPRGPQAFRGASAYTMGCPQGPHKPHPMRARQGAGGGTPKEAALAEPSTLRAI